MTTLRQRALEHCFKNNIPITNRGAIHVTISDTYDIRAKYYANNCTLGYRDYDVAFKYACVRGDLNMMKMIKRSGCPLDLGVGMHHALMHVGCVTWLNQWVPIKMTAPMSDDVFELYTGAIDYRYISTMKQMPAEYRFTVILRQAHRMPYTYDMWCAAFARSPSQLRQHILEVFRAGICTIPDEGKHTPIWQWASPWGLMSMGCAQTAFTVAITINDLEFIKLHHESMHTNQIYWCLVSADVGRFLITHRSDCDVASMRDPELISDVMTFEHIDHFMWQKPCTERAILKALEIPSKRWNYYMTTLFDIAVTIGSVAILRELGWSPIAVSTKIASVDVMRYLISKNYHTSELVVNANTSECLDLVCESRDVDYGALYIASTPLIKNMRFTNLRCEANSVACQYRRITSDEINAQIITGRDTYELCKSALKCDYWIPNLDIFKYGHPKTLSLLIRDSRFHPNMIPLGANTHIAVYHPLYK